MVDKRPLQRMPCPEPFDRRHCGAIAVDGGDEARIDGRAVDQNGARATLPFTASLLRARELAVFAQHVEQTLHRMHGETPAAPVDGQLHARRIFSGVAGISRTSMPAWRSALTTAGAGPSIGISPTPFAPNGPCG